jgi:hypothetical protein
MKNHASQTRGVELSLIAKIDADAETASNIKPKPWGDRACNHQSNQQMGKFRNSITARAVFAFVCVRER